MQRVFAEVSSDVTRRTTCQYVGMAASKDAVIRLVAAFDAALPPYAYVETVNWNGRRWELD